MFKFLRRLIGSGGDPQSPSSDSDDDPEWEPAGQRGRCKRFLPAYAADLQIYASETVAGISFRKDDALVFARSRRQTIELQREPQNTHDRNAIGIYGVCNRGRALIGYVPKGLAAQIARSGMFAELQPRASSGSSKRQATKAVRISRSSFKFSVPRGRRKSSPSQPHGGRRPTKQARPPSVCIRVESRVTGDAD